MKQCIRVMHDTYAGKAFRHFRELIPLAVPSAGIGDSYERDLTPAGGIDHQALVADIFKTAAVDLRARQYCIVVAKHAVERDPGLFAVR